MIDAKLGTSILSWMLPTWNDTDGKNAILQTKAAGFDLLEILLPTSMNIDTHAIRQTLKEQDLGVTCSLNLPTSAHVSKYPDEALQLMKLATDKTEALGSTFLGGVLHAGIGYFTGDVLQENEKETIVQVWTEFANYAAQKGISIGVEPVNRYESYVCNTAKNVLELEAKTGCDNLYLHLDTFHMNIEETNCYDPIIEAGDRLKYVHITESNRGLLGEGMVHWDDFFQALDTINFKGSLVLENFSSSIPGMSQAVSLWQPSKYDNKTLAEKSLAFLQKHIAAYK